MKLLNSIYIKITSWLLLVSFIYVYVFCDYAYAVHPPKPSIEQELQSNPPIDIPLEYGKVISRYKDDTSPNRLVLIQDLHANYETQSNIRDILKYISLNYGIQKLWVEGSSDKVDTSLISTIPSETVKQDVLDYFMRKGMITGPESYAIDSGNPVLYGLEDNELYEKNSKVLVSSLNRRNEYVGLLERIKYLLKTAEARICNSDLKKFRTHYVLYRQKELTPELFQKYLKDWSKKAGISIGSISEEYFRFMRLTDKYDSIDHKALETEYTKLLAKSELIYEGKNKIEAALVKFKNFFRMPDDIQKQISEIIYTEEGYRNLRTYLECIQLSREIDTYQIVKEEDRVVEALTDSLCRTESERNFVRVTRYIDLIVKFLLNQMTPRELDEFYGKADEFLAEYESLESISLEEFAEIGELLIALKSYMEEMGLFYSIAIERDKGFVERVTADEVKNNTILITGGFHSYGVSKILKEKNIPHIIVKPVVTQHTEEDRARYYSFIRGGELLSYEDVLSLTLAPKSFIPMMWFRRRAVARAAGKKLRDELAKAGYEESKLHRKLGNILQNFLREWFRGYVKISIDEKEEKVLEKSDLCDDCLGRIQKFIE